jgi:hypothetical protein
MLPWCPLACKQCEEFTKPNYTKSNAKITPLVYIFRKKDLKNNLTFKEESSLTREKTHTPK